MHCATFAGVNKSATWRIYKGKQKKALRETGKQNRVAVIEVVADYSKPDHLRTVEALMLLLDLDDLPASEHEDAISLSDSVS